MEKISILKIITNVFVIPWNNRRIYSQALAPPILLLVGVYTLWLILSIWYPLIGWIMFALYFLAFSYLATVCHKLVLETDISARQALSINFLTLVRFSFFMFLVYSLSKLMEYSALTAFISIYEIVQPTASNGASLTGNSMEANQVFDLTKDVAYLLFMYVIGRLCLVFPAIVLGFKPGLKWSWQATRNSHLHIFFIVALFPWALKILLMTLYRDDATVYEQVVFGLLTYITAALSVVAISLIYKELQTIQMNNT